jgi:hypothetical protein
MYDGSDTADAGAAALLLLLRPHLRDLLFWLLLLVQSVLCL